MLVNTPSFAFSTDLMVLFWGSLLICSWIEYEVMLVTVAGRHVYDCQNSECDGIAGDVRYP